MILPLIEAADIGVTIPMTQLYSLVSSEESFEGKLFVQFSALMIISYIKKQMDKHRLFKKYTLMELLDELGIIERFTQTGKKAAVGKVTKKQRELYEMMDADPPA